MSEGALKKLVQSGLTISFYKILIFSDLSPNCYITPGKRGLCQLSDCELFGRGLFLKV